MIGLRDRRCGRELNADAEAKCPCLALMSVSRARMRAALLLEGDRSLSSPRSIGVYSELSVFFSDVEHRLLGLTILVLDRSGARISVVLEDVVELHLMILLIVFFSGLFRGNHLDSLFTSCSLQSWVSSTFSRRFRALFPLGHAASEAARNVGSTWLRQPSLRRLRLISICSPSFLDIHGPTSCLLGAHDRCCIFFCCLLLSAGHLYRW